LSNLPVDVLIGLGGNLGDPRASMCEALRKIDDHEACVIHHVSSVWNTPPWGLTDQPDFLNACAMLTTTLSARSFLMLCLDIELGLKRVRLSRWGPRSIDIDILFFGDQVIDEPGLVVPHPRIFERAFVMVPLAEIAPTRMFKGQSIAHLAAGSDKAGMKLLESSAWYTCKSASDLS
jgi:2-amino-4-hydroxy-6-hydroxymethyldihydropteridine diphosphokinase